MYISIKVTINYTTIFFYWKEFDFMYTLNNQLMMQCWVPFSSCNSKFEPQAQLYMKWKVTAMIYEITYIKICHVYHNCDCVAIKDKLFSKHRSSWYLSRTMEWYMIYKHESNECQ